MRPSRQAWDSDVTSFLNDFTQQRQTTRPFIIFLSLNAQLETYRRTIFSCYVGRDFFHLIRRTTKVDEKEQNSILIQTLTICAHLREGRPYRTD